MSRHCVFSPCTEVWCRRKGSARASLASLSSLPPLSLWGAFPRTNGCVPGGGWDSPVGGMLPSLLGQGRGAFCSARSVPPNGLTGLRPFPADTGCPSEHPLSTPLHVQVPCRHRTRSLFFPFCSYKMFSLILGRFLPRRCRSSAPVPALWLEDCFQWSQSSCPAWG